MKYYCLGFVFDPDQEHVLLLGKRSSDPYNPGVWNGIGGHLERNETALDAMVRECQEEAGLRVDVSCWETLGSLTDDNSFHVSLFAARAHLDAATQMTDEVIRVFDRASAANLDFAHDVDRVLGGWLKGGTLI